MIGQSNIQKSIVNNQPLLQVNQNASVAADNNIASKIDSASNAATQREIMNMESSLFKGVLENSMLKDVAGISRSNPYTDQSKRFIALGRAVIELKDLGLDGKAKERAISICDKNGVNQPTGGVTTVKISQCGEDYIHQFINKQTVLDTTNYATGLIIGSDKAKGRSDRFLIKNFDATWNIRIKLAK